VDVNAPRKAKTKAGQRVLDARAPKLIENEKKCIFMRGQTCSNLIGKALTDLCALKKPSGKLLSNKNPIRPFEDATSIEFLTRVNDSSIFCFGSHSKKRPHSIVFGRTFDFQILDMLEFQVDAATFKTMDEFSASRTSTSRVGAKPMFVFLGDQFTHSEEMKTFRSVLLDTFHGLDVTKTNLSGLDRAIVVTATVHPTDLTQKIVYFRHYNVLKKRSGTRFPRVELEEVGPRMDLTFNRSTAGSTDIRKAAMRHAKGAKMAKRKNVEIGQMGQLLGRVHMEKQNLDEIALAKLKGLGKRVNPGQKRREPSADEEGGAGLSDDWKVVAGDVQSKKRARMIPKAYASAVISE